LTAEKGLKKFQETGIPGAILNQRNHAGREGAGWGRPQGKRKKPPSHFGGGGMRLQTNKKQTLFPAKNGSLVLLQAHCLFAGFHDLSFPVGHFSLHGNCTGEFWRGEGGCCPQSGGQRCFLGRPIAFRRIILFCGFGGEIFSRGKGRNGPRALHDFWARTWQKR